MKTNIYIYIYIYIYMYILYITMCVYIYIYIQRERERERCGIRGQARCSPLAGRALFERHLTCHFRKRATSVPAYFFLIIFENLV